MHDPVPPDMHGRIRQAFLLGLSRQPVTPPPQLPGLLPPGSQPALALLALTGQRQRFAGPPQKTPDPVPDAARILHQDPRPILPPAARHALRRLAGSSARSEAGGVMPLALHRVRAAGCRLHPFDLPELAWHIEANVESQGIAERAWLALVASDADDEVRKGLLFDPITAENWTAFPKAQRRRFVTDVRRNDPAAGRALVEGVWKTEAAAVRAALLEALAVGLGRDDKPFLDRLATDRAHTVKEIAGRLLGRIATAEDLEQRIAAAARCFTRRGGAAGRMMAALGIAGRGTLSFALPERLTSQDQQADRERLFGGLPLDRLAAAVGATPAELVVALPEDEHQVRALLLEQAVAADHPATMHAIAAARLIAIRQVSGPAIKLLATESRLAVDPDVAARFLAGPAWREAVSASSAEDMTEGESFAFAATLMPREAMPAFLASLAALPSGAVRAARDFADLVLALPA